MTSTASGTEATRPAPAVPIGESNLAILVEGIAAVALLLSADAGSEESAAAHERWADFVDHLAAVGDDVPLAQLAARFRLDSFELTCVTLALASHLEPRMSTIVAYSGGDTFSRALTVRLVLERFCRHPAERLQARRSFLPSGRLVRGRLVALGRTEVGSSESLLSRRFELTAPTLRFLLQETELTGQVAQVARVTQPEVSLLNVILPAEQLAQVRELVAQHERYRDLIQAWGFERVLPYGRGLTLLFSGPSGTGKTLLAQALAAHAQVPLVSVNAADLPEAQGLDAVLRDIFAEATMRAAIVLVDECEALLGPSDKRRATTFRAIEDFEGILIGVTNHPDRLDPAFERRIVYHLPFEIPGPELRRQIWEVHLPPEVPLGDDVDLDALASTYDFAGGTIKNAILVAVNRALAQAPKKPLLSAALLDEGCRSQLRYALEDLTVRTTTHLRLGDIVLPEDSDKLVREIISACRNQSTVLNRWGFGRRLVTGKGITVLFDGPPGTGKTYCAEIIAGELDRPLYRINLPEVVSKWVGETEKHIKAIFQQARVSHAMLLFDEADSLFAARSAETKSATDRYANMEVNLLLQEIERFPGICILTTNSYGALDKALVRRIQFRVTFAEPDVASRERIWRVLTPAEAPLAEDVELGVLAKRYELTGAMVKNALLRAAYHACETGSRMTMAILDRACTDEYKAAGKVTQDASKRGPTPREQAERAAAAWAAPGPTSAPGGAAPGGRPARRGARRETR
jgi:SpoVK/Ycf46/Vps4 family AAA+-type ATPase